jgi:hypothetical protein
MSGALLASTGASPATVAFVGAYAVSNGGDTNGTFYQVPTIAKIGDTVLFFGQAQPGSSNAAPPPPGSNWTTVATYNATNDGVYAKRMSSSSDLSDGKVSGGGYIMFTVYRGALSFGVVNPRGFTRNQNHAGVAFFGGQKPAPATQRATMNPIGVASDFLPPLIYPDGTNYNQIAAVEFRSQ